MRMVRHAPEELVLLHRPLLLCAALVAAALLLFWVAMSNAAAGDWPRAGLALVATIALIGPAIWFAAERVDVRFDARAGQVMIRTRRLSGTEEQIYPLSGVERAMIQTHKGRSDSSDAHRIALVMHPGRLEDRLALTTGYAS